MNFVLTHNRWWWWWSMIMRWQTYLVVLVIPSYLTITQCYLPPIFSFAVRTAIDMNSTGEWHRSVGVVSAIQPVGRNTLPAFLRELSITSPFKHLSTFWRLFFWFAFVGHSCIVILTIDVLFLTCMLLVTVICKPINCELLIIKVDSQEVTISNFALIV